MEQSLINQVIDDNEGELFYFDAEIKKKYAPSIEVLMSDMNAILPNYWNVFKTLFTGKRKVLTTKFDTFAPDLHISEKQRFIVAFSGKKRSGKDTLANFFKHNSHICLISFATPLKILCRDLFLFSESQLYGEEKDTFDIRWGTTPRKIMQAVATKLKNIWKSNNENRNVQKLSLWVSWTNDKISTLDKKTSILIPDLRFSDEAQYIRELGGRIYRINRIFPTNVLDTHESECELDGYELFDGVINNNFSIEKLFESFLKLVINI